MQNVYKNSSLFQTSLFALVGAALFATSCSKGGGSSGTSESTQQSSQQEVKPKLKLSVSPIEQIETKVNTIKETKIVLENKGTEAVSDIALSGIEPPLSISENGNLCKDKVLEANESCEVSINFKPEEVNNGIQHIELNYKNKLGTEIGDEKFDISYLGSGEAKLDVSEPPQIIAGIGESQTVTLTVTNKGDDAAKNIEFTPLNSPLSITQNNCKGNLPKDGSCEIDVKFSPTEIKSGMESLKISYNDIISNSENKLIKEIEIPYSSFSEAKLKVDTGKNKLVANEGKKKIRTVTVTNEGTGPAKQLTLPKVTSPLSIAKNTCEQELPAGKSCEFDLEFSPTSVSDVVSKKLEIKFADKGKTQSIIAPISYMSIAKDVLNLSNYKVRASNLELDTVCKKKEVYGNGIHNIPLIPKFTATDSEGKAIEVNMDELVDVTQVLLRRGSSDIPLSQGTSVDTNEVFFEKNSFSKCIDAGSGSSVPNKAAYFKTAAAGQTLVLGAKIKFVDQDGKIGTVSTSDSGRRSIEVLKEILYPEKSIFKFDQEKKGYANVSATTYSIVRISPKIEEYPALNEYEVTSASLNDYTYNGYDIGSGLKNIHFTEKDPETDDFLTDKTYGWSYGRMIDQSTLFAFKRLPKDKSSGYQFDNWYFSYSRYKQNDLGLKTRSQFWFGGLLRGNVYFRFVLNGLDAYGNKFSYSASTDDTGLYL